jgi:hypothetical protein
MPKIVINEYDLTKPGTREYSNFSVVVPGFVGANADLTVFDENGVYECATQNDFVANIGKKSNVITIRRTVSEAVAPEVYASFILNTNLVADVIDEETKTYKYSTKDAFNAAMAKVAEGEMPTAEGEAVVAVPSECDLYYAVANTTGEIGELKITDKQFVEAEAFKKSDDAHTVAIVDGTLVINNVAVPDQTAII